MKDKERALEICKMRIDGRTYEEIGSMMGFSKQRVEQILKELLTTKSRRNYANKCVYPYIKNWMKANRYTITKVSELCEMNAASVSGYLRGNNVLSVRFVQKVMEHSGLTFEEVIFMFESEGTSNDKV